MTQVGSVSEKDCHAVMMECTLTFSFVPLFKINNLKIHLDAEGGNGSWSDWEYACSSPCGPGNLGMVRNFLNQQQNQIQEISRLQEVALQRDLAWGTSKG